MDGDDRVEHDEGERVVAQRPLEERLLRLADVQAGRLALDAQVGEVGGAVLGDVAVIAADDGVERGHRLAEAQRVLDDAVEAHRVAVDVAEQRQLRRAAAGDEPAGVLVGDRHRRRRRGASAGCSVVVGVSSLMRTAPMPRACPVVPHARCYRRREGTIFFSPVATSLTIHGASPWDSLMPRACPVVFHARCYRRREEKNFFPSPVATILPIHGASPWDSVAALASSAAGRARPPCAMSSGLSSVLPILTSSASAASLAAAASPSTAPSRVSSDKRAILGHRGQCRPRRACRQVRHRDALIMDLSGAACAASRPDRSVAAGHAVEGHPIRQHAAGDLGARVAVGHAPRPGRPWRGFPGRRPAASSSSALSTGLLGASGGKGGDGLAPQRPIERHVGAGRGDGDERVGGDAKPARRPAQAAQRLEQWADQFARHRPAPRLLLRGPCPTRSTSGQRRGNCRA